MQCFITASASAYSSGKTKWIEKCIYQTKFYFIVGFIKQDVRIFPFIF